jgi:L-2-hydroxyglutarate oxidase
VIDYGEVGRSLAVELRDSGLELRVGAALLSAAPRADGLDIATSEGDFRARALISCAGLHSDRVAARLGVQTDIRILPFLGQYHALSEEHAARVRGLVYPVPDPSLPFLGIHLTRRIGGVVDAGPNARLAMGREAYETGDFSLRDLIDVASFSGSYALLWRHRRAALSELRRASSRHKLVEEISRLLPGVGTADLTACPAGIRAQAVRRDGSLIHDFVIEEGERSIHVLNAPSPAATASLAIGEELCARALALLN